MRDDNEDEDDDDDDDDDDDTGEEEEDEEEEEEEEEDDEYGAKASWMAQNRILYSNRYKVKSIVTICGLNRVFIKHMKLTKLRLFNLRSASFFL